MISLKRKLKLVVVFGMPIIVAYLLYDTHLLALLGTDSCQWLLRTGTLTNTLGWQPYGCSFHWYTTEEARNCMKTASQNTSRPNLFVFGGDSTMRGFFTDFVDHFTYRKWHPFSQNDVFWQDPKIRLHVYYMWQTFVDSPWLIPFFGAKPAKNLKPSLLVASGGVWYNAFFMWKNFRALAFKKNMLRWAAEINATGIPMIWRIQATVSNTHLPNDKQVWVTAEMTEKLNSVATGVVEKYDRFRIWNTGANVLKQLIVKTNKVLFRDWVHVCHASHEYEIQVLLNFYCNRFTNLGTCCDTYPSFTETDREKLHPDLSTRRIIICSFTVVWFLAICSCFWSLVVKNYPIVILISIAFILGAWNLFCAVFDARL